MAKWEFFYQITEKYVIILLLYFIKKQLLNVMFEVFTFLLAKFCFSQEVIPRFWPKIEKGFFGQRSFVEGVGPV